MTPINILFYALASFMGMEAPLIVCSQIVVTINSVDKTIEIVQEDLFSIITTPADSMVIVEEWQHILKFEHGKAHNGFTIEHLSWDSHKGRLNATLRIRYTDSKTLEEAGIYYNEEPGYALINVLDWNIESTDAVLNGNYWVWPETKQVTFSSKPFESIPLEVMACKESMLDYWKGLSDEKG